MASAIGNLLWFLVAGLVAGADPHRRRLGFCLTIIGIPFGVASFKLAGVGLFPLGKRVVETEPPRDWMHAGSGVSRTAGAAATDGWHPGAVSSSSTGDMARVEKELLARWPESRLEPSLTRITALVDLLGSRTARCPSSRWPAPTARRRRRG